VRIPIVLAALVINAVLSVILIPELGPLGGAIATSVAYAVYMPAHLVFLHRALRLDLRALALTLVRGVVAAGALAGVLALFGTRDVGNAELVLGGLAGLAAFAAVLVVTGEVRRDDIRTLRAGS
jgi:O-antigen/teichoic acid export membrane protein